MRDLRVEEIAHVYGAGGKGRDPQPCHGKDDKHGHSGSKSKSRSKSKSKDKHGSRSKKY